MNNLVPLFEEALEFQNFNGSVLSNGKVKVYFIGRTSLADIYNDVAGEYPSENPKILDNLGMGPIYVNPAFDYEIVVYDEYDNELFSVKKYLHSNGAHSTSNVEVVPSENIQVSAWTQGDVQVYMPYITGNLGKVYSGIEPIVVNNDEDKISANHVALGLQEPLYFVEDSESACIIGIDSSACGKTYSGISPILVDNTANTISITGDIGKDWTEEILSAANDASAAATAWTNSQGYLTSLPDDLVYTGDLNDYAKKDFVLSSIDSSTSGLLPTSSFSSVSGSFLTALPSDLISSQSGTIFVSGYEIEGTNSAIATATVQGFVTSLNNETIGPNGTASFSWWKSVPNTIFTFTANWPNRDTIVTYSANTNLTGEIIAPGHTATKLDIAVPNATALNVWADDWFMMTDCVASASDSVGMTVGELAWASALPIYQYDSSNKISAINGSALANYELPTSVSAATDCVTANSAIWNSVTGKLETTAFSDVSGTFLTSLPADVAYTGWVENSIVSATSGLQPSGNYIPYTATEDSLTAFETNSGLLIRHTILGGLNSTYIGDNVQVHYMNGGPQNLKGAVLGYNKLSFETNSDTAYVDREKIHKWDSASDYIQNNSATINEVNASYQTNSGSFLTAVDLTPYQLTADMTAYQPAGDYLTTADSANFYTTANESGYITAVPDTYLQNTDLSTEDGKVTAISGIPLSAGGEVPAGTMNESAFSYDASDNITAYNGSAFKAGDEFPQSATEAIETVTANSATWNETTDTVTANSGAWGGSALPISAGVGIKVDLVDNTLVFSNDETVLWDTGTATWTGDIVVNEAFSNFDRVKVLFGRGYDNAIYNEFAGAAPQWRCQSTIQAGNCILNYTNYTISGGVSAIKNSDLRWTLNTSNSITYAGTAYPNTVYKVIGINRIAGGN